MAWSIWNLGEWEVRGRGCTVYTAGKSYFSLMRYNRKLLLLCTMRV